MDHEVLDEGCKTCSALRNEIDKKNAQIEHNNAQQLTGFLTLKQKIIGTDKLIREYQASKVERDILTRKNEEFVHLIDQLHRDLSIQNRDYTQLCCDAELLRKANSEYEVKVKQLSEETQKWKSQAEAGLNFTSQLVEKVKILEKYEEEVKHTAAVSRECEKTESKLQVLKGQLKDAKETTIKSKKELNKMQKDYTQLLKYAKQWGKIAETQGKLNTLQKRFFIKLCNKEVRETEDEVDPDNVEANEIDEQSKLLEHLLDDGNGSESVIPSSDTLLQDTELTTVNLMTLSKPRGKSPGDSTFRKQTGQSPIRAEKRSGQDNGTSSKIKSPNKTPPRSLTTRARTRTPSQNSISQSSDADNVLESGKENNKRPGPRTRSRSVKIAQLSGPKDPELFLTPKHRPADAQPTSLGSAGDMSCRSLVSMDTLLMTDTTPVQGRFQNIDLHSSLSSAESELEPLGPQKPFQDNRTFAKTSTMLMTESIVGVKPLVNLEPDVTPQQRSSEQGTRIMDQFVAKAQPEFERSVNSSSLFGFDSDSSSDSDVEMIPVPSCHTHLPIANDNHDRNTSQDSNPSLTIAVLDRVGVPTRNPSRKPVVGELQHSLASETNMRCTDDVSRSIFALEANLEIDSPTTNASKSLEEKTSELPSPEVAVPFTLSLEDELGTVVPESGDTQVSNSHGDIGTVSNADIVEKLGHKIPIVESNRDTELHVANEKNLGESAAKQADTSFENFDELSSVLIKDSAENDRKSLTREAAEDLACGTEVSDTNDVPTSIFALDMDLDISSSEPDSDVVKPPEETESDSSNIEAFLQAPLTFLDGESSTVVQEIFQDPTSHHGDDAIPIVETNQGLPSETPVVETGRESELIDVDGENLGESPGVEIDILFKKPEKGITEELDELQESDVKLVTNEPLQEFASGIGESNCHDVPSGTIVLDMDVDITSSQPSSDVVKPTEEGNSELPCANPLSFNEESSTIVREIPNVEDSSEIARENKGVRSEVSEAKTDREFEPLVVSEGDLVKDVSCKRHEERSPPQADESNISEENTVTRESLQVPEPATGDADTVNAPSIIYAVDMGLDISSSESDSDVTKPTEEPQSKLLNAEIADHSPIHLHEDPVVATPGSVNVQGPESHCDSESVLEEYHSEVQPIEIRPECELLLVNEANVGVFSGMKMDVPPTRQQETDSEPMEGEYPGTKGMVLSEKHDETHPEKIDESMRSEDKSSNRKSPENPMPTMGDSDSSMAKSTEETQSLLPIREVAPSSSPDPASGNFVPGSVTVQETDTGQGWSAASNVGTNKGLPNEVLADEINSESGILSVCNGDDTGESPYGRMDIVSKKHEEPSTEQIDGLKKSDREMVAIRSPKCPALETDESDSTNVQSSVFALDVDLDISPSEPELDATAYLVEEKKSELTRKEVVHQGPPVGETPVTVIAESGEERPPFMKMDMASETHEEPSSQLVCTTTESDEKSLTVVCQRYPTSGSGESDAKNVPCSISVLTGDLDVSSSEPDSDETKHVEERKTGLSHSEVNIHIPFPLDEEPSLVAPVKVMVQMSESRVGCGALSNVEADQELCNEVPMVEGNRESGEVRRKVIESSINEKEQVLHVGESLSEKETDEEFDDEAQTTSDVVEPKLTAFPATPTRPTAVPSSPLNQSGRVISGHVLSSNQPVLSEETLGVDTPIQHDAARPTGAPSPRRFPMADVRDGNLAKIDGQFSPVHRSRSAQESFVSPSIRSNLPDQMTPPAPPQILQPVRTSAFKVPRVPDAPPRVPDVISADLTQTYPWNRGSPQGLKRSAADEEVAVILKQIRTNIIEMPATVSPLPKSPDPQLVVSVKIEQPKSRFPILPRCAFNWTGKKLPLSDKLTERFGAYLHPGVQVRVRFRRVSRRLRDIRSPDILSNRFQGVTNFAEAERRPKPIVNSVQLVEDVTDLIGLEDTSTDPTQKPGTSAQNPSDLPEKRSSTSCSSNKVDEFPLPAPNPTSSSKRKRKVKSPVSRLKTTAPALFGSSSSESECESTAVSQHIQEQVNERSSERNLNAKKLGVVQSKECIQTPSLVNTSRAQAMAQLVEPIVPLGRANRTELSLLKPNEVRREAESGFNPSRVGLGLGRGAKASQPTIAPCSDALLSAAINSKTMSRAITSPKHIFKEPQVSREPVIAIPVVPDSLPVQDKSPFRKRISHVLKRGSDSDSVVSPASKRGRNQWEGPLTASPQTAQSNVPAETPSEESSVTAGRRSKNRSALPIQHQEIVKLGATNQPSLGNEESTLESVQPKNFSCTKETAIDDATSASDTEPGSAVLREVSSDGTSQTCSQGEKRVTISNGSENKILVEGARSRHLLLENPERSIVDESPCSPDMEESPQSPDEEVNPRSNDIEVSQKTAGVESTSKSRMDQQLQTYEKNAGSTTTVLEIPLACSTGTEENQPTAFELILKELLQKSPPINRKIGKLKKDINVCVNRVFKSPDVTEESWSGLIERAMRFDSKNNPFILIRKLIASVIKDWDSPMDLSKTPPAPPMTPVHQRCVMILKELDETNSKLPVELSDNLNFFSNLFLSESSAVVFQPDSSLTLEEMCSLARAYTAVCRSRASLARARTFLFDCVYFMPPRSYALTYTIMSVWAEVLRQISFPLGPSCIDQTITYLLLHNCKVKAVQGNAGKVLKMRSFLQNTHGYKDVTARTIDDLVNYLMTRFIETNSADEASSLSWSLALLARWEGIDFAIEVIEKQLWPFLQRWSSGEGTNSGAAAVIVAIGMLGKTVPSNKRAGVKRVLSAMKVLLQSDEVIPSIHEAAIEAVVLLGEEEDPNSVIEVVKAWKLVNANLSHHLRQVLKAFLKRHSSLVVASQ